MDISAVASCSSAVTHPLDLHISVYVTCLCNPEAVPPIINCDVVTFRPSIHQLLIDLITPPTVIPSSSPFHNNKLKPTPGGPRKELPFDSSTEPSTEIVIVDEERGVLPSAEKLPWLTLGGGMAVCASGPASVTTETANAVSRIQLSGRGRDLGGVGLHTETFSL